MIELMKNQIQQLRQRTPLGWLQLKHQKTRFLVALAGITFADILMFMQLGFQTALYDGNTRLHSKLQADILLISPQARNLSYLFTFPRRRLFQAMDVPGVKSVEAMYIGSTYWKNPQTDKRTEILVIGIDPNQQAFDVPEINRQLNLTKLSDTVLFDRSSQGNYDQVIAKIDRGKSVTTEIRRQTLTISGLFKMGASFFAEANLITSDQNYLRIFYEQKSSNINLGLIQVKPGYNAQQISNFLTEYLSTSHDIKAMTKNEFIQFEKNYWRRSTPIGLMFGIGVTMGFIVGVIMVYQVLSSDVNAHIKEYATFKAMGYRNAFLLLVVFEEAIILAVLGFIPGLAVSIGLYTCIRNLTNLPLMMTITRVIEVQVLTIIMCMISGAIATRKVQLADPADIFD